MKFRKKPVIVEAEQFSEISSQIQRGVCGYGGKCKYDTHRVLCLHVHTIHNNQAVPLEDGDWVIPEGDGIHFYPCKPDIFAATYEKVEDREIDDDSLYCEWCFQRLGTCNCEDEVLAHEENRPRCGCKYCVCSDTSEYGETCGNCSAGAHQG